MPLLCRYIKASIIWAIIMRIESSSMYILTRKSWSRLPVVRSGDFVWIDSTFLDFYFKRDIWTGHVWVCVFEVGNMQLLELFCFIHFHFRPPRSGSA